MNLARRLLCHILILSSVALAIALGYANTLDVPFYFDDLPNIVNNSHLMLTEWDARALVEAGRQSPLPTRSLAYMSFALNHLASGFEVRGFHLLNLAIHLIASMFIYLLALELLRAVGSGNREQQHRRAIVAIAAFCALVFALHPIQTQAVTFIVQRMASMSAMFYLAAVYLYIKGRMSAVHGTRVMLWLAAALAWVLALASKEIAVTLPFAIALYEWCFSARAGQSARHITPLVVGVVLAALLAGGVLVIATFGINPIKSILAGYSVHPFTLGERLLTETRVIMYYLSLITWPDPSRLTLLHDFEISRSLFKPLSTAFSILAIVTSIIIAARVRARAPLVTFAVGWFYLHLLVESTILPLGLLFEHRLYLPMLGPIMLMACGLIAIPPAPLPKGMVACIVIGSLAVMTHQRNEIWREPVAFWSDVVAKNASSVAAKNNLANALLANAEFARAEPLLRSAVKLEPRDARVRSNFAVSLFSLGRLDEAAAHLRIALRQRPDLAEAHFLLAQILEKQGRRSLARQHYQRATRLQLRPGTTLRAPSPSARAE
jgi:hypothetical protein